MMIYVDELRDGWPNYKFCYLYSDTIDELLNFAIGIGININLLVVSEFGGEYKFYHFILDNDMRNKAILNGAIEVDIIFYIKFIRNIKRGNNE